MSALTPDHAAAARAVAAALADATKAVVGAVRDYEQALSRLVYSALSSGTTTAEFRAEHKALLKEFAEAAYLDGLKTGGVEELTDEDADAIAAWLTEQRGYVNDYAKFVAGVRAMPPAERAAASKEAIARLVFWVQAMENLQGQGKASALKNMMVTWRLGRTEDHCRTCASLDGKRHRMSWFTDREYIPQQVGSETLDCGGWNCDCSLVDDKGKRILP